MLWAAIVENIDRRDFDILELMVEEIGNATEAAARLGKSKGWVPQRRALLNLAPELQEKLRAGDLAVREARALAQVPFAEQGSAIPHAPHQDGWMSAVVMVWMFCMKP